jgi:1-acyl-sn-glycerol-3-phosphate acyltransferase
MAFQIVITPPYAFIVLLAAPLAPFTRHRIITIWSKVMMFAIRHICGIRYQVRGAERLPRQPCVVLANHQSAWETIAFQMIFPPQVFVIKRELLWLPFFGWGLALMSPIAIDREARARALRQMIEQGKERLAMGFWIIVYPEGTRVVPGRSGRYRIGGASIAAHAGAPVLPVAHNAGVFWPRQSFLKYPGMITVSIGPAIETGGLKADTITSRAQKWIEDEVAQLAQDRR